MIKRFFAVLVSVILWSSAGYSPTAYEPFNEKELEGSAVILSDIHIESNNFERFPRTGKIFAGVNAAKVKPDVVAFTGDNTMNGQNIEWFDFYGFVNRFLKGSKILVCFGNHDFGNTSDHGVYEKLSASCINNYNTFCRESIDKVYYSRTVNGVRYIVLGSQDNAERTVSVINDDQLAWLRAELKQCGEDGTPAVVLNHNLVYGRNGDRSTYDFNITSNDEALDEALQSSPVTTLYFSGHSHFGVNSGTISTSGNVTYINLPSAGNNGNYASEGEYSESGVGCYVEFYDGFIRLSMRNFISGKALDGFDGIEIATGAKV